MLACDISVLVANAEGRSHRDIRHFGNREYLFNHLLAHFDIFNTLAEIEVLHRASRVEELKLVLKSDRFHNVIGISDGKLSGVGVVYDLLASRDDIGILSLVKSGKTVSRALCGCCFKVVVVSRLFGTQP